MPRRRRRFRCFWVAGVWARVERAGPPRLFADIPGSGRGRAGGRRASSAEGDPGRGRRSTGKGGSQ
eukprot:6035308-Lingulodinium_polyedra.AAC.1